MKKRIIAAIVLALFTLGIGATAQVNRPKTRPNTTKAEAKVNCIDGARMIAEKLGLTTEQKQRIADIAKAYFDQIKPILQSNITKEEKIAQIEPVRARAIDSIMAVLTPEQQAKARDMGLADRMLRPLKNHAAAGIMYALSQLNLSEQQKTTIKAILEDSHVRAKAIKENTTLTPEQKRVQFAELKKATHDQIMNMLTPEQQQKLNEMLAKQRQQKQRDGQPKPERPAGQKTRVK